MEKVQGKEKKGNFLVPIIVVLVVAILILLFLLSPLKEMLFPSASDPEVALSVVESFGPDSETGLYRIVVEADVEGKPEPQVTFTRNDGIGEMEANQTLILLEEEETYLLRVLATNTEGSAEAELELFAEIMVGTASGRADSGGGTDVGEPTPDSDEDEPDADLSSELSPDADEDDMDVDDEGEPAGPRIVDILLLVGLDIVDLLDRPDESHPLRYEEDTHRFKVNVECESEEALDFQVEATHGIIDRVGPGMAAEGAPDNIRPFVFTWRSPANPAGNLEALNVRITVSATDPFGACDTQIIRFALLPEPEDRPDMTANYDPITTLTGQVNEDGPVFKSADSSGAPSIYVGDLASNIQVKGFISFDISELAGKNIISARLNIKGTAVGTPAAYSGNLVIYSTNYGSSLDSADYSAPKNSIRSFRPGFVDLSFSNDQLRDYLQSVTTAGGQYAQFVLAYAGITNNGTADGRSILVQDVSLEVTYN
jgi:hypothetical protein